MAVAVAPGARPTGPAVFTWDGSSYVRAGQPVPAVAVRQAIDTVIEKSAARMRGLTERLVSGGTDLASWQQGAAAEIKSLHVAIGIVASGGQAQLSQAGYGFLGSQIKPQYQFLNQFAADLASGKTPLNGRAVARADLYSRAAAGTFYEVQRRDERRKGNRLEARMRRASESCADCVGYAAQGYVPLGTLPAIGSASRCRTRCKCVFVWRDAE